MVRQANAGNRGFGSGRSFFDLACSGDRTVPDGPNLARDRGGGQDVVEHW
jgi:hypothetical protein